MTTPPPSQEGPSNRHSVLPKAETRRYYSVRTGKNPAAVTDLPILANLFKVLYGNLRRKDYLYQHFGYECVDAGSVPGTLGEDIDGALFMKLRKQGLWPIETHLATYSEDDLFDIIEFIYDHISVPSNGFVHSFYNCGTHGYETFDRDEARREFRQEINSLLHDYAEGFELSEAGEILSSADPGLKPLTDASLPTYDPANVELRVQSAIHKFRRHRASLDDRRDAVRDLADVLEFLRPKLSKAISKKDEADLFNIANNFAIRHHNPEQKADYDRSVWYSWIFYVYLSTIHTAVRLIQRHELLTLKPPKTSKPN